MRIPIESACWRALACSEAPASYHASAASHRFPEDIGVLAVVETELKLREIQRQISLAHVVIGPHDSTLEQESAPISCRHFDHVGNAF